MKEYRITQEGYEKLLKDLDYLVKVKRKEIAERLKEAKNAGGDLSENLEYEYVKNEQAFVEGRIEQINDILQNFVIVDKKVNKDVVDIGSVVVVRDLDLNKNRKFEIVSSVESEPSQMKISDESPLGSALLGKKIKDEVTVKTPGKVFRLKIIDII
ncbi:MAG: transcription elongation factor GreA [Actinobacteria bacterium]|nr:transcription elongation factor GreA [Cyanobacteriota bacterium]MCL5771753.1 transcription elongation factor GreA [Actinomycetota bacterium]